MGEAYVELKGPLCGCNHDFTGTKHFRQCGGHRHSFDYSFEEVDTRTEREQSKDEGEVGHVLIDVRSHPTVVSSGTDSVDAFSIIVKATRPVIIHVAPLLVDIPTTLGPTPASLKHPTDMTTYPTGDIIMRDTHTSMRQRDRHQVITVCERPLFLVLARSQASSYLLVWCLIFEGFLS